VGGELSGQGVVIMPGRIFLMNVFLFSDLEESISFVLVEGIKESG